MEFTPGRGEITRLLGLNRDAVVFGRDAALSASWAYNAERRWGNPQNSRKARIDKQKNGAALRFLSVTIISSFLHDRLKPNQSRLAYMKSAQNGGASGPAVVVSWFLRKAVATEALWMPLQHFLRSLRNLGVPANLPA